MGGNMKGHNNSNNGRSGPTIRSRYVILLLFALGAAIIGAMAVQKLRERLTFNLLINQKDAQISSLQLLLQKERDYSKETKRDSKEMKSKLYTLRAQKIDLDGSVLEMRSTISSLKDEHRAMEAALEEKQNEFNALRGRVAEFDRENLKLISLSQLLKQKEAEIEGLKNRTGEPVKVWSVVSDDPANLTLALATENANNSTKVGNGNGIESRVDEEVSRNSEESLEGSTKDVEVLERKENATEGRGRSRKMKGKRGKRFVKEKSEESELESKKAVSEGQKEIARSKIVEKMSERMEEKKTDNGKVEIGTADQDSDLEKKRVDGEETEETDVGIQKSGNHGIKESESKLE